MTTPFLSYANKGLRNFGESPANNSSPDKLLQVGKFHNYGRKENFPGGSFDFHLINPELFDLVLRRFRNSFTKLNKEIINK